MTVDLLDDPLVRDGLKRAWFESHPGSDEAHEEGGFVVAIPDGTHAIVRWPKGRLNTIEVPSHPSGTYGGRVVVATFHTHPNPSPSFQQEPSLTDIRAVRFDPDLRHAEYLGEFVVSADTLYQIRPDGSVRELGDTRTLLNLT